MKMKGWGSLGRCQNTNPDCFSMLFSKFPQTSSFSPPLTVTVPFFEGWWNCLWLPFWRAKTHQSFFKSRMILITFAVFTRQR